MSPFRIAIPLIFSASISAADDAALVIGIDDYSALGSEVGLNGAAADAAKFANFLERHEGFDPASIHSLTNGQATSDAILSTLIDQLVSTTIAGDRVVLYFAGLGTRMPDGTPALIAHDADALLGNIPATVITDLLNLISDRDVTVVLDTSFDGDPSLIGSAAARGISGGLGADLFSTQQAGRTIWTAAASGEFAWETLDQGVFTQNYIDGIENGVADANGDGTITPDELLAHLRTRSNLWCETSNPCVASGRSLTPQRIGAGVDHELATSAPEAALVAPPVEAIVPDDGGFASYNETLGFITDLFAPSNSADLDLTIEGGSELRINQQVKIAVTARSEGTLVLLDVDPSGALAQVFPSSLAPTGSTRMQPGETLNVPNGLGPSGKPVILRVREPAGQGVLLALFVEDDLDTLTALLPENLSGGPIENAGQYLYSLSQDLLSLQASNSDQVSWSATYLPYRIQP